MPVGATLGIGPTCRAEAIARHKVVARDPGSPIKYVMVLDFAGSGVRVAALGVWVSAYVHQKVSLPGRRLALESYA